MKNSLQEYLQDHKMSQQQLAVMLGVSLTTIRQYIAGTTLPCGDHLNKLISVTGITRETLLKERQERQAETLQPFND
jgi:transcriptional regulator with XRE-family HTH domain